MIKAEETLAIVRYLRKKINMYQRLIDKNQQQAAASSGLERKHLQERADFFKRVIVELQSMIDDDLLAKEESSV